MKKKRFAAPVLVGVLALGIIGSGSVFAQTNEPEGTEEEQSTVTSLTARVAEILGLAEAQVEDALDQARAEIQDERVQAYLDRLVANGRITQEQADAYLEWYEARPEGLNLGPGFGSAFGPRGFHGGPGMCFERIASATPEATPETTPEATAQAA